jgi:DnaJ domain
MAMIHTHIDPYAVLGVAPDAEPEVITAAYRVLAKKWHPDVNPAGGSRMKEINEAFAIVSDPVKRREYEQQRPRTASEPQADRSPAAQATRSSPPPEPRPVSCERHPFADAIRLCDRCWRPLCYICQAHARQSACVQCQITELEMNLGIATALFLGAALSAWFVSRSVSTALATAYMAASIHCGGRIWRWLAQRWTNSIGIGASPSPGFASLAWWLWRLPLLAALGMPILPFWASWTAVKTGLLYREER